MTINNQQSKINDFAEFDFADDVQVKDDAGDAVVEAKNVGAQNLEPMQKAIQNSPHIERIIAQQLSSKQSSVLPKSKLFSKNQGEKVGWFKKIFSKKKVETKQSEKKPIAEIVRFAYEPEVEAPKIIPDMSVENVALLQGTKPEIDRNKEIDKLEINKNKEIGKLEIKSEIKPKISVPDQIVSVLSESFKKVEPKTLEMLKKKEKGVGVQNLEPISTKIVLPTQENQPEISRNKEINRNKEIEKLEIGRNKEIKKDEGKKEFSYAVSVDKLLEGYDGAQYFKKETKTQNIEPAQTKVVLPKQEVKSEIDRNKEIDSYKEIGKLEIDRNKEIKKEEEKEFPYAVNIEKLLEGYDGAQYFKKEKVGAQNLEPVQTKVVLPVKEIKTEIDGNKEIGKLLNTPPTPPLEVGKTKEEEKFVLPRKRVIQNREDESLVYDNKDAEELSEVKTVSGPIIFKEEKVEDFQIAELVRRLVKDIQIVNGLKINMIERLNMIIDSYLRDVRTGVETKFLLKKSVEEGGMGFSADQVDQIMSIVSATYKQIHLSKGASEVITSKTAKENQIGVFSESIKKPEILPMVNQTVSNKELGVANLEKKSWFKKIFGGKKKIETKKIPVLPEIKKVGVQNLEPIQKPVQTKVVLPKQEIKPEIDRNKEIEKLELNRNKLFNTSPNPSLKEGKSIEEKKELPVEIKPNLAKLRSSIDNNNNKPKMADIKIVRPHLTGPIEELSEMTVMDFRRLAPTIEDIAAKIVEKISLINQESFSKHLAGVNAWRASQPNQLYLKMARESIMNNQDIVELINKAKEEKKTVLSLAEFKMINQMNRGFRF